MCFPFGRVWACPVCCDTGVVHPSFASVKLVGSIFEIHPFLFNWFAYCNMAVYFFMLNIQIARIVNFIIPIVDEQWICCRHGSFLAASLFVSVFTFNYGSTTRGNKKRKPQLMDISEVGTMTTAIVFSLSHMQWWCCMRGDYRDVRYKMDLLWVDAIFVKGPYKCRRVQWRSKDKVNQKKVQGKMSKKKAKAARWHAMQ